MGAAPSRRWFVRFGVRCGHTVLEPSRAEMALGVAPCLLHSHGNARYCPFPLPGVEHASSGA
jgi:hypothetical protein